MLFGPPSPFSTPPYDFRLAVVVVKVPPLRERGDDIVLMAKAFLHNYAGEHAKPGLTFAPDALRALSRKSRIVEV